MIREHNLLRTVQRWRAVKHVWPTVQQCARRLRTRNDVVRLLASVDRRLRIDVVYPYGNPVDRTELVRRNYRTKDR